MRNPGCREGQPTFTDPGTALVTFMFSMSFTWQIYFAR